MAKPTTKSFAQFILEIQDPEDEDTWIAPAGFLSKSLTLSGQSSDVIVPDKDEPEAPAWTERGISTLSGQVQGAGVMAADDTALWEEWFDSGAERVIRARIPGLGYRQGSALLTNLGSSTALNSDGNKVQRSVTIDSTGPWEWTSGNPA